MKCKCGRKAVFESYCKEHFLEYFEQKVKKTILKHNMVSKKDRIAVGVSGGKDSLITIYLLNKWFPGQVFSITIDEGIKGYREKTIQVLEKNFSGWDIESHIFSFKEEFDYSLDKIISKLKGFPCSYCGVLRRNLLNRKSREFGATKIAVGHNLDDEAQTVLMNIFRHDHSRMDRIRPVLNYSSKKFIPRIKPLFEMTEKQTKAYSFLMGFFEDSYKCPYVDVSMRHRIRSALNEYESKNKGSKKNIIKAFLEYEQKKQSKKIPFCKICSEPTSSDICQSCKIINQLKRS